MNNSNNNDNYTCVFIKKMKMKLEALNITTQLILSDVVFQWL